ncbi:hypothetical protein BH20ACI4_BH20ACI4_10400 [soil metagenome]
MKKRNRFLALVCFLLFVVSANSQNKSVAVKFDEFTDSFDSSYYPYEEIKFSERIERFIKQIKKERAVKVYIIYYQPRVLYKNDVYQIRNQASLTRSEITYKTKLESDDVVEINGGYRENPTIEYWIAPRTAAPPNPTPTFDKSDSFLCPKVYILEDRLKFYETKQINFYVPTYDINQTDHIDTNPREIIYEWKVSAGEIVEGKGTHEIKVKINNSDTKRITAFVKVKGLPFPCETNAVLTVETGNKPYLFDRAERYNHSDLAARLDAFMITIMQNPALKGYIVVYADRKLGTRNMERAIKSVQTYFGYRGFDSSRVTIIRGGFREYSTVDSWILPEGAEPPIPTPTVDKNFIDLPVKAKPKKIRKRK